MADPTPTSKKVISGNASEDFLHLLNAKQEVISWIDSDGIGQGALAKSSDSLNFSNEEVVSITAGSSTGMLINTPNNNLFLFSRNGILQKSTADYSRSGAIITLVIPAEDNDEFLAWYTY